MIIRIIIIVNLLCVLNSYAQDSIVEKIPLDHSVYNDWKILKNPEISNNGEWISYEINPQKGDGWLFIYNNKTGLKDSISRGYYAEFSPNSDYLIFKIKPQDTVTRKAKLEKKLKDFMPKDTLGIKVFHYYRSDIKKSDILKEGKIKQIIYPRGNSSWFAYMTELKDTLWKNQDTNYTRYNLTIINPSLEKVFKYKNVTECSISKNGTRIGFITYRKDKTDTSKKGTGISEIHYFDTQKEISENIFRRKGFTKKIAIDSTGNQMAFIFSIDTSKSKTFSLFYYNQKKDSAVKLIDNSSNDMKKGWSISIYDSIFFSNDGNKIYIPVSPNPIPEPKDTLTEDEKCKVDIWNWQDEQLQSQQLHDLEKEKKRAYLSCYDIQQNKLIHLADTIITDVKLLNKGNGKIALGISDVPYRKLSSWEDATYKDYYIINTETGEKKLILEKKKYFADISPSGKYLIWYETTDSSYYSYEIYGGNIYNLTKSIPVKFYDELFDRPNDPEPYGIAGWTTNDGYILVYDRFDVWKISSDNSTEPTNITNGRNENISYRYVKLDKEEQFIDINKKLFLKGINQSDFSEGIYYYDFNTSEKQSYVIYPNTITSIEKSRNSDKLIWQKASYTEFPDLWLSDLNFKDVIKITDANPQQKNYIWGTVELVKWKNSDNQEMQGLLYKPENFYSTKKYPMIVYFYERYTDKFNSHYIPNPGRSVINFPLYNSNGYLIFIPDIYYKIGYPGESAYDAVVSGTNALIECGYVDKYRIGLQGQSWGGYQVAYIITKTNMFCAAMAGAAVCNMTSAYGGIRLESGVTRIFQYEQGQSRIGGTLWDKFDFYILNSPLFKADKIYTPLLLMANDNDGAVPWQQGIEFFVSLRRLNKPVWLMNYNGDEHNLTKWANRLDHAKRMKQFFDHYLKDEPMPKWMSEGIPAKYKGLKLGFETDKK